MDETQSIVSTAMKVAAAKSMELADSVTLVEEAMSGQEDAAAKLGMALDDNYMKNKALGGAYGDLWEGMSEAEKAQARLNEILGQGKSYNMAAYEARIRDR